MKREWFEDDFRFGVKKKDTKKFGFGDWLFVSLHPQTDEIV